MIFLVPSFLSAKERKHIVKPGKPLQYKRGHILNVFHFIQEKTKCSKNYFSCRFSRYTNLLLLMLFVFYIYCIILIEITTTWYSYWNSHESGHVLKYWMFSRLLVFTQVLVTLKWIYCFPYIYIYLMVLYCI